MITSCESQLPAVVAPREVVARLPPRPHISEIVGEPRLIVPEASQLEEVSFGAVIKGGRVSLTVTLCVKKVGIPEQSDAVHVLVMRRLQPTVPEVTSTGPFTTSLLQLSEKRGAVRDTVEEILHSAVKDC